MSTRVLQGITWKNPRGYDPLVAASRVWMDLNPDSSVNWQQLPWYEFENKILRSLAAGDGQFDLIMFDHPWTGKMASENWLIPWNTLSGHTYLNELAQRVVSPSLESYALYGSQWALPLDSACHCGLFRADMADRSSLPRTWETLRGWAEKHHNPPHRYSLILSIEGVLGSCLFLSMMAGLGFQPYTDEQSPSCNKEAAAYVLTILSDLLAFTPPGSTILGPWDVYERFCSNDDVIYSPSIFAYVNYFGGDGGGQYLRVCEVPGFNNGAVGTPILGGVGLGVAHTCTNIDQARSLGEFLMSESVQQHVFPGHSGQPSTKAAWTNPQINKQFNNFYADLSPGMSSAYIRPRYPKFHYIELEIGKILQQWWDKETDLAAILNQLNNFR